MEDGGSKKHFAPCSSILHPRSSTLDPRSASSPSRYVPFAEWEGQHGKALPERKKATRSSREGVIPCVRLFWLLWWESWACSWPARLTPVTAIADRVEWRTGPPARSSIAAAPITATSASASAAATTTPVASTTTGGT